METWRHGVMKTQRHGDTEKRRHRDTEARLHGDTETRTPGDGETWRRGDVETWRYGDIKRKTAAQLIFLNPFTVCSLSFVRLLTKEQTKAIRLQTAKRTKRTGTNGLAHLCQAPNSPSPKTSQIRDVPSLKMS